MKFLALMGLAVIIQCASAAQESGKTEKGSEVLFLANGCTDPECQRLKAQGEKGLKTCPVCCPLLPRPDTYAAQDLQEAETLTQAEEDEELPEGGLESEEKDGDITLYSVEDEGKEHPVYISAKAAPLSGLVRRAMEVMEVDREFPGVKCSVEALRAIGEYLNAHDGETRDTELAKPIRTKNMATIAAYDNAKGFTDAGFIDGLGSRNFQALTGQEPALATADHPADMSADGKRVVFDVILGANYLECTELLHLGCAKIATVIKGQNADMIKNLLGDNDYGVVAGVPTQMAGRRRRLSKESRSILSEMFGTAF